MGDHVALHKHSQCIERCPELHEAYKQPSLLLQGCFNEWLVGDKGRRPVYGHFDTVGEAADPPPRSDNIMISTRERRRPRRPQQHHGLGSIFKSLTLQWCLPSALGRASRHTSATARHSALAFCCPSGVTLMAWA